MCFREVFIQSNSEIPALRESLLDSEKIYLQGTSHLFIHQIVLGSQHIKLDVSLDMDKTYGD